MLLEHLEKRQRLLMLLGVVGECRGKD